MDIRNIHIPDTELKPTEYLDKMFELALTQLEGYRKIENLPDYPLDINTPNSQVILKDFISRVIEELTEGYESTEELFSIMSNIGWNLSLIDDYSKVLNALQNANEEQADAIGFFITLLNYSGILPEDIYSYVSIKLDKEIKTLEEVISYGVYLLLRPYEGTVRVNLHSIYDPIFIPKSGYVIFSKELAEEYNLDYDKINSYSPGFHDISGETHEFEVLLLWKIVYTLNITRNLLKNRPWKQTQVMTKELDYQESLVKSFILYLGFLGVYGFTPKTIFELFHRKQQLNCWRQETGY